MIRSLFRVVPILLTGVALLLVAARLDRGFDLRDEGYYLVSAEHPGSFTVSTTHFGFYTGALFHLVGSNIALFRLAGLVLLVLASLWFALGLDSVCQTSAGPDNPVLERAVRISTVVSAALFYYAWLGGLLTPSYNWLNLTALLLGYGGLLRIFVAPDARVKAGKLYGAVALGAAMALTAFAKPISAVGLSAVTLVWFAWYARPPRTNQRKYIPRILLAVVSGMLAVFVLHFCCFESPRSLMNGYASGKYALGLSRTGHSISEILAAAGSDLLHTPRSLLQTIHPKGVLFVTLATMIAGALVLGYRFLSGYLRHPATASAAFAGVSGHPLIPRLLRGFGRRLPALVSLIICAILLVLALPVLRPNHNNIIGYTLGVGIVSYAFVAVAGLARWLWSGLCPKVEIDRQAEPLPAHNPYLRLASAVARSRWDRSAPIHDSRLSASDASLAVPALLLSLGPMVYSFGTNAQIINHNAGAAVFLIAASVLVFDQCSFDGKRPLFVDLFPVLALGCVIGSLVTAANLPYASSTPVSKQTTAVRIGASHSHLRVDARTAAYFQEMSAAANRSGFAHGQTVIDLTGMSPGTIFALGGQVEGSPWLMRGSPGSPQFAAYYIRRMDPARRRSAWVLTAPNVPTALPPSLLTDIGLDFPHGYQLVATATWPHLNETHQLWKPRNPAQRGHRPPPM